MVRREAERGDFYRGVDPSPISASFGVKKLNGMHYITFLRYNLVSTRQLGKNQNLN